MEKKLDENEEDHEADRKARRYNRKVRCELR